MIPQADRADTVEAVIEEAYGAILEPARWSRMLALFLQAVGAERGALHAPPSGARGVRLFVRHGLDPGAMPQAARSFQRRAPFIERATDLGLTPGVFLNHHVIPYDELHRADYYQQVLAPMDLEHGLTLVFSGPEADGGLPIALSAARGRGAASFDEAALATAWRIYPHLRRAVRLTLDVDAVRQVDPAMANALQRLDTACLLLGAGGRVLFANQAALERLAGGDDLKLRRDRLTARPDRGGDILDEALRRACDLAESWSSRAGAEVIIPREKGPPRLVVVTPFGPDNPFAAVGPVRAGVYLLDGVQDPTPRRGQGLRVLFGLTAAEAEIAVALIGGDSLSTIAARRGVAHSTVKSQARMILDKTQSSRLVDLHRFRDLLGWRI